MINYSENKSNSNQIHNHLLKCDKSFLPKLSTYINIKEYSKKIFTKSIRFECFDGARLIGLIAAYKGEKLYITNVSTDPDYAKEGIGTALMKMSEDYCKNNKLKIIELEVKVQNDRAISFYEEKGFKAKCLTYEKRL